MTGVHPPPLALLAEITHRCPLRCPYCSNPLELSRRSGEMTTREWLGLLDEARNGGTFQSRLGPSVRPHQYFRKKPADAGCHE